ncbi:zinc finger MYM-type protein 1-like [Olea europaea var. sylvestris]|uniref:zinc finger MYM-type protein 1-like n=1 Tax=Olea europaea var. sylvestris TaxID=158386 RepID=UPI000C1D8AA6|nr:zinc finger MYM-type protein 1-like [Olea europaea var. sylvestris]
MKRGILVSIVDWYVRNKMGLSGTSNAVSTYIRELGILACNSEQIYWHEGFKVGHGCLSPAMPLKVEAPPVSVPAPVTGGRFSLIQSFSVSHSVTLSVTWNVDSVDEGASNNVDVDEGLTNDVEFDVTKLPTDPCLRIPILDYNANIRDEARRAYMLKGLCQPQDHNFPKQQFGVTIRRFNRSWFKEFGSWLEYSVEKDAAYCLYCYLFKTSFGKQGGGESFVGEGFTYWKDKKRLHTHVGLHDSAHNQARIKCEVLMNQEQHIQSVFYKQSEQARNAYVTRLNASIDCNFLVQYQFLAAHNEVINAITLGNAPHNCKLTSPDVQKDIVNACAIEMINVIIKDVGDSLFFILVDESCDVSMKEQISIVLRYVDNSGRVNERFIGIEHVTSTAALSLKAAIDKVFSRYNLSMSRLRGQGYDGASNMQGKFKGLKTLILNESPCAFYIHCFAHQLQLALVAVAKKNIPITNFFGVVGNVINTVGASSKRCDLLREKQLDFIVEALEKGEILSGRGLNQETTLQRSGDTRWSSHYNSLVSLLAIFSSIVDVLAIIIEDESCSCDQRSNATNLLELIQGFNFAFNLQLMRSVLGISNELSKALQRKDQDIVNAMQLVRLCKRRLQIMRDEGWDSFLEEVCSFCQKYYLYVPNMDDMFVRLAIPGRPQHNSPEITNLHHYRVDLFYSVIDLQLQELNDHFSEVNTELLLCLACLCPQDSFSSFDKKNLIRLVELYPLDFSAVDEFEGLNGLGDLAEKLVLTKKDKVYPLVYRLLTLALILPVATATVESVFSAMSIVKNRLCNRMGDQCKFLVASMTSSMGNTTKSHGKYTFRTSSSKLIRSSSTLYRRSQDLLARSPEVQLLLRWHSKISLSTSCCIDSVTMLTDFMTDARALRLALDMGGAKVFRELLEYNSSNHLHILNLNLWPL